MISSTDSEMHWSKLSCRLYSDALPSFSVLSSSEITKIWSESDPSVILIWYDVLKSRCKYVVCDTTYSKDYSAILQIMENIPKNGIDTDNPVFSKGSLLSRWHFPCSHISRARTSSRRCCTQGTLPPSHGLSRPSRSTIERHGRRRLQSF